MKIQFLGATRQVTGSCYYLEASGLRMLVDCGLFQERPYLERNWLPFPVPPEEIDVLLLTHAHLDHAGLIPRLVQQGFSQRILATAASVDLARIVLLDSAHILQEDAAFKKKRHEKEGRRGPYPEVPLYTVKDAESTFPLFQETSYVRFTALNDRLSVRFHDAGHILGSAMLEILAEENGSRRRLIFSGDIGQWDKPLVRDPSLFEEADYVIMESTYGDRDHEDSGTVENRLCQIINETVKAGGNIVIPVFAVERAQEMMFYLSQLIRDNRIPQMDVFCDSPMALEVTEIFKVHPEYMDQETHALFQSGRDPFDFPGLRLIRSQEESKAINRMPSSCIIMAGSGMCTGGRIKHHLIQNIERTESTILFVGYQARHTLGRQILEQNPEVRINGQFFQVKARIEQIQGFSGHAGRKDLLRWLGNFQKPPRHLFLTHGEEDVTLHLSQFLQNQQRGEISVPAYKETFVLN
ncbi:MAG: MBL fold metallo-hydrolase [Candidatus Aminicenantales bacterium]